MPPPVSSRLWRRAWGSALTLLILVAPGLARAESDLRQIGPQSDAAALRAARAAEPGPAPHLGFELRDGAAPPVPIMVWIGADYLDVAESGRETLYDFRLRRRLSLDRAAGGFVNVSLYGDVAFRRIELVRRTALAQMYGGATGGQEPPLTLRPFWIESQVGLARAAPPRPVITQKKLADGALSFTTAGEQVALFAPQGEPLPAAMRRRFAHFLQYRLPLHPAIVAAIAADGRLPQRLVLIEATGDDRRPVGLILRRSETVESDYPLPASLTPRLDLRGDDPDTAALRPLLPVMLEAVAGRSGGGPRSLADYRHAIDVALRQRQDFHAALLLAEASLQFGRKAYDCSYGPRDAPCHPAQEINRRLAADPRAVALYKAQSLEGKDPAAAIKIWQGIERGDVSDGYVVDSFIATRESLTGKQDAAMPGFAAALRGNPYMGGLYKDLGDHFLHVSRSDLAWLCYDLGRSLPGADGSGLFAAVDALERELVQRYPDLF